MFAIISTLDRAIQSGKMVHISYGRYCLEQNKKTGRWEPRLQPREKDAADEMDFEPYALMWSNGYYYLVGKHRGMMNLRVDRIRRAEILQDRDCAPPQGFDPVSYRDRSSVMYAGKPQRAVLLCPAWMLSVVMDFFGSAAQYTSQDDGSIRVVLSAVPIGVRLFALQYVDCVEVLEPEKLRCSIAKALRKASETYRGELEEKD